MALPTVDAVFFFLCVFRIFCQKNCNSFFYQTSGPERMSVSSQTYLFNSNYNIDPSTMVIRRFKNVRFFC